MFYIDSQAQMFVNTSRIFCIEEISDSTSLQSIFYSQTNGKWEMNLPYFFFKYIITITKQNIHSLWENITCFKCLNTKIYVTVWGLNVFKKSSTIRTSLLKIKVWMFFFPYPVIRIQFYFHNFKYIVNISLWSVQLLVLF